jgi:hypothetical protein
MSPLIVIETVDGFAPAALVPAAKLEENVNPLTGLPTVTVPGPATFRGRTLGDSESVRFENTALHVPC